MEKIIFEIPETNEKVEFTVEEQTTLNGINYLLVSDEEDACILKEITSEENESTYEIVEDDTEFEALAKVFSELLGEDTDLEY